MDPVSHLAKARDTDQTPMESDPLHYNFPELTDLSAVGTQTHDLTQRISPDRTPSLSLSPSISGMECAPD